MNRWRYSLEEQSVQFTSHRSNGQRLLDISYSSDRDESAVSDVKILDGKSCVPSVPCAPVSEREALSTGITESTRQQNKMAKFGDRRQMWNTSETERKAWQSGWHRQKRKCYKAVPMTSAWAWQTIFYFRLLNRATQIIFSLCILTGNQKIQPKIQGRK